MAEDNDLQGEVAVSVTRFSDAACSGTAIDTQTKSVTLVRGGPVAMLEFRFVGMTPDAGVDAGVDAGIDGGLDAGCDLSACGNTPGTCETMPATGCATDGGCRFTRAATGTACGTGACNAQGVCVANACSVLAEGATCDDGLTCTSASTCSAGTCRGTCSPPPQCRELVTPITCDQADSCTLRNLPDEGSCTTAPSSRCLAGTCLPWLPFQPRNFDGGITSVPYPLGAWTLGDGGTCDTVISTSGAGAAVLDGGCGSPAITSTVDALGNAVITMTGLDVAPNAKLHFVGDRPVQLVVLGDATIRGLVSVAPTVPGQLPAGSASTACSPVQGGDMAREGGGGGGFGGSGGPGGASGGAGGAANSTSALVLRGGCAGGNGFRNSGNSPGGVGGGAIQLIVRGTLAINGGGTIAASGGGGAPGTADDEGGGGGGSGGMVLLEANVTNLNGGFVTANGGGGGEGGDDGETSQGGEAGLFSSASGAPGGNAASSLGGAGGTGGAGMSVNGGTPGDGSSRGGGGGGGAAGVVFIGGGTCVRGNGVISGFFPQGFVCN